MTGLLLGMVGLVWAGLGGDFRLKNTIVKQDLELFRAGNHLAHWAFPDGDWHRHVLGWQAGIQELVNYIRWGGVFAGALVGAFVAGNMPMSLAAVIDTLLATVGVAALGWLAGAMLRSWGYSRAHSMLLQGGEIYVGQSSAYFTGKYLHWGTSYRQLVEARLLKGATTYLVLTTTQKQGRRTLRVPLPPGCEDEADRVVEALREIAKI